MGGFKLKMPNQEIIRFGHPGNSRPVIMEIRDYNFFPRVIVDGEIGFGEAYMHAEWDTPDLLELLKILIRNRDHFSDGNLLFSFISRIQEKTAHDSRKNSIKNASENIRAHYDLSNAFYELFLDDQMLYSCGIFQESRRQPGKGPNP